MLTFKRYFFLFLVFVAHLHAQVENLEQSGHFAEALKVARLGCPPAIARLEGEVLHLGASRLLFDQHLQPRAKLIQLLELTGMEKLNRCEQTIVKINHWAQQNLLRKGERWEEQPDRFEHLKAQLMPLLYDLGFVKATRPSFQTYQGALVHGATLTIVQLRLHYLVSLWKEGIRFPQLIFLTGERPLEPQQENREAFNQIGKNCKMGDMPKTEREMMEVVWEQSEIPDDMRRGVKIQFVDAPMKKDHRPTTDDTIIAWLKTTPAKGRYLAISNAPFTNRQDLVIRSIAPEYDFDTVGPGVENVPVKMAIFLDEVARCIYTQMTFCEKK